MQKDQSFRQMFAEAPSFGESNPAVQQQPAVNWPGLEADLMKQAWDEGEAQEKQPPVGVLSGAVASTIPKIADAGGAYQPFVPKIADAGVDTKPAPNGWEAYQAWRVSNGLGLDGEPAPLTPEIADAGGAYRPPPTPAISDPLPLSFDQEYRRAYQPWTDAYGAPTEGTAQKQRPSDWQLLQDQLVNQMGVPPAIADDSGMYPPGRVKNPKFDGDWIQPNIADGDSAYRPPPSIRYRPHGQGFNPSNGRGPALEGQPMNGHGRYWEGAAPAPAGVVDANTQLNVNGVEQPHPWANLPPARKYRPT